MSEKTKTKTNRRSYMKDPDRNYRIAETKQTENISRV